MKKIIYILIVALAWACGSNKKEDKGPNFPALKGTYKPIDIYSGYTDRGYKLRIDTTEDGFLWCNLQAYIENAPYSLDLFYLSDSIREIESIYHAGDRDVFKAIVREDLGRIFTTPDAELVASIENIKDSVTADTIGRNEIRYRQNGQRHKLTIRSIK